MTLMITSQNGIELIKKFEGCKLSAYRDAVGVPTIGYGTTQGVTMGMTITKEKAEEFLKRDVKSIESALNKLGKNFKQNQFDALVSWIYNLGLGSFGKSTMKKKIVENASDIDITDQLIRWVNAGGKPLLGLKKRRVAEANMFLGRETYYRSTLGTIVKKVNN